MTTAEILSREILAQLEIIKADIANLRQQGPPDVSRPVYLSVADLEARWQCSYDVALAFMHRRGSGAIKIGKKYLVTLKEVEAYERMKEVRTG